MRFVLYRKIFKRSKGKEFVDYLRKTLLQRNEARFPISILNYWDNNVEQTNNNRVEGDNEKIKQGS